MQDKTSDVFSALAHPTRRQILQDLKQGELAAGDIASRFSTSGPTISRHLAVLKNAGLVTERRDANRILYSLVGDRLALSVGDFLSTVCPEQIVLREARKVRGDRAAGAGASSVAGDGVDASASESAGAGADARESAKGSANAGAGAGRSLDSRTATAAATAAASG